LYFGTRRRNACEETEGSNARGCCGSMKRSSSTVYPLTKRWKVSAAIVRLGVYAFSTDSIRPRPPVHPESTHESRTQPRCSSRTVTVWVRRPAPADPSCSRSCLVVKAWPARRSRRTDCPAPREDSGTRPWDPPRPAPIRSCVQQHALARRVPRRVQRPDDRRGRFREFLCMVLLRDRARGPRACGGLPSSDRCDICPPPKMANPSAYSRYS
jgi:hypothetical protein